jgi:hypothetical protein
MKDNVILWEGALVEFEGAIAGSSGVYLRENDGNPIQDDLQVNLVAAQRATPVNVSIAIVDSLTTAVAGVHYNDLSGGTVVIPANESLGFVDFEILDDNINPGETWVVAYAITGGDVPASENYKVVEHSIQVTCDSDIGGTYNYSNAFDTPYGSGTATGSVEMTDNGDGNYTFDDMSFGLYGSFYGLAAPPGGVLDVCDVITGTGDADQFGDPFTITGTRNPSSGVIDLSFSNTFGDSGDVTLTPQ